MLRKIFYEVNLMLLNFLTSKCDETKFLIKTVEDEDYRKLNIILENVLHIYLPNIKMNVSSSLIFRYYLNEIPVCSNFKEDR